MKALQRNLALAVAGYARSLREGRPEYEQRTWNYKILDLLARIELERMFQREGN